MTLLLEHQAKHARELVGRKSTVGSFSSWITDYLQTIEQVISYPFSAGQSSLRVLSEEDFGDGIFSDEEDDADSLTSASIYELPSWHNISPPESGTPGPGDLPTFDVIVPKGKKRWWKSILKSDARTSKTGESSRKPRLPLPWSFGRKKS